MKKSKLFALMVLIAFLFVCGSQVEAAKAKKKVVEGGRMQLKGTEGKVGDWLLNGTARFKVLSVEYPKAWSNGDKVQKGEKLILVKVEIKNTLKFTSAFGGPNCKLTLVDKDDQIFEKMFNVNKTDWKKREGAVRLLPAAGLKTVYVGSAPEDFLPVRLIFQVAPKAPVFRVSL